MNQTLLNHHATRKDIETKLEELLKEYQSQFTQGETMIWDTPLCKMRIDIGDSQPVSRNIYPIVIKHYKWGRDKSNKFLTAKVI